jgi:hypothetical protein
MGTITEKLQDLARLKEHRDDAKSDYDEYKRRHAELEAELIERMAEEDVDSMKSGGINFVPARTPYGSVNDRAAFIEWCKESGNDDLLEVKERKQLINQIAREHLDDGRPLPPGMAFYVKEYISQRAG